MVLHPKTEPIRLVLSDLDRAAPYAKLVHARQLAELTLTLLSESMHAIDRLEARIVALERFPELPTRPGPRDSSA